MFGNALCASCPLTSDVSLRREIDGSIPFILGGDSFDSRSSPCQTWETGQDRQRQTRSRDVACGGFGRATPRRIRPETKRMRRIRINLWRATVLWSLVAVFSADCRGVGETMKMSMEVEVSLSLAPIAAWWVASVVRYRQLFGYALCASCPLTSDVSLRREIDGSIPFILGGSS